MKNKGQLIDQVVGYIGILGALFVVMLTYILFDQIVQVDLYDMAIDNGVNADKLSQLMWSWNNWPFMVIFALFIMGLVIALDRRPRTGYV